MSNAWAQLKTQQREKIRARILKRDQYTCYYCGQEARTVDHVVPTSKGGPLLDEDNMVAACVSCNSAKKDRSVFSSNKQNPRPYLRFLSPMQRKPAESPFERPETT